MSYKFQNGAAKLGGAIDATALTGAISPDSMSDGINAVVTAGSALTKTFNDGADTVTFDVGVDDSSIEVSSDALQVKALGVTNAMLAGSIADSKLNTISTADKVAGSAVQLQSNKGLENSSGLGVVLKANAGLEVDSSGIAVSLSGSTLASDAGGLHLSSSVAGHGLFFGLDQLEVRHSVGTLGSTPATLAYGINVQTVDMTGSLTHTLPTPVVAGRTVIVKAKNAAANTMTIATGATGDKIDGVLDDIAIESDGGAVTLMGVAADRWIIV